MCKSYFWHVYDLDLLFTEAAAAELAAQQAEEEEAEEGRQLLHASPHCMTVLTVFFCPHSFVIPTCYLSP